MNKIAVHTPPANRGGPTLPKGQHLAEQFASPKTKRAFVNVLFDVISGRYDRFTRIFSFGMDRRWKRELLAELAARVPTDAGVLDMACGTGDIALATARTIPGCRVVGVDLSTRMIRLADQRRKIERVTRAAFCRGDMTDIGLADHSMDAVTIGYGIRNAPALGSALDEVARVLKPGGVLVILDFYRPANALWRRLFLGYLRFSGTMFGWWWHRAPVAYGYIAASIERYVSWQAFNLELEAQGFVVERVRRKFFGGICIHAARYRTLA